MIIPISEVAFAALKYGDNVHLLTRDDLQIDAECTVISKSFQENTKVWVNVDRLISSVGIPINKQHICAHIDDIYVNDNGTNGWVNTPIFGEVPSES